MNFLDVCHYCPKCASPDFTYFLPNAKVCAKCGFRFFDGPVGAVAALIADGQDRLLAGVRRDDPKKGMLSLPGGFMDHNETTEEAIRREVKEETNLDLAEITYFGNAKNIYTYQGTDRHTVDFFFLCKVETFDGMKADDDVEKLVWIPKNEVKIDDFAFESTRDMVQKWINGL